MADDKDFVLKGLLQHNYFPTTRQQRRIAAHIHFGKFHTRSCNAVGHARARGKRQRPKRWI